MNKISNNKSSKKKASDIAISNKEMLERLKGNGRNLYAN